MIVPGDLPRSFHFPSQAITAHPRRMNAAQQEVLDKVIELLSEHFDHAIVAVGWYDEDKQYSTTATYSGGVAPALGLCKLYETKWQKEHLWGSDDDE
jgi:hypothetical protein